MFNSEQFNEVKEKICLPLIDNGYEVFIVGGAIRNTILGLPVEEFDLTTNATPKEIEACFDKTIPTGKAFGTITVLIQNGSGSGCNSYEITTYRSESAYSDSRHPSQLQFETSIHNDLKRRDFTINAMAYNPVSSEFIDNYAGIADIQAKRIRTIGDAKDRFSEDTLRIFRACRFAATLSFELDETIETVIKQMAPSFTLPSAERIGSELNKLMRAKLPSKLLKAMKNWGLLERISVCFECVSDQKIAAIDCTKLSLRWATLLEKSNYQVIGKALRFSRKQMRTIHLLIQANLDKKKAFASVKQLNISSFELMKLGYKGRGLGNIQKKLLMHILENPNDNELDILLSLARKESENESK